MRFSVITPAYNAGTKLRDALLSTQRQLAYEPTFEVIVVDDGSTDGSVEQLRRVGLSGITFLRHAATRGPGVARNTGMAAAAGEWLVFLDADDELAPSTLAELDDFISCHGPDLDLVRFGRSDLRSEEQFFTGDRAHLLRSYVSLRMDGSVCGTAVRRETLGELNFRPGYHEDVDWLYLAYSLARQVAYLDEPLYRKGSPGLTSVVTQKHLEGFITAWQVVAHAYGAQQPTPNDDALERGVLAVVATRWREIVTKAPQASRRDLCAYLFSLLPEAWVAVCRDTTLQTQYAKAARFFVGLGHVLGEYAPTVLTQTWSCKDLHGSAYLGPDEVRACCKRFFVNGEQRGDVVLLKDITQVTPQDTQAAKQDLLTAINAGEETSCSSCPWLEFKAWGPVPEQVSYLSMEQHSVCNLQCSYCDSKYWDGRRPTYDAAALAEALIVDGGTVVWGGGEPTVSPEFQALLTHWAARGIQQRVLSNSVKHSPLLQAALDSDNVELVTSVDAGTVEMFQRVRGMNKLWQVFENLTRYADSAADRVTIKYILTEENCTDSELGAFVFQVQAHYLTDCNFQLSCDFRQETASWADLRAMLLLHRLLREAGAECVFLDDLARLRVNALLRATPIDAHQWVEPSTQRVVTAVLDQPVASPHMYPEVVVWGRGEMADLLLQQTAFFKTAHYAMQTDSSTWDLDYQRWRSFVAGDRNELPIVIAASQAYPRIFHELVARGLSHRIVKEVIL